MSTIAYDFLRGPDWASRFIALGTGGPYSHVAHVIWDAVHGERYLDARDDVLDGVPRGVHIRRPSSEPRVLTRRASLQVTPEEYAIWEASARAKITTDYDDGAILGFLEGKSIHTAGRWICSALAINSIQHLSRSWDSSTLTAWAMRHCGYVPFPLSMPAHRISPNALMLILETAGFTLGPEQHE